MKNNIDKQNLETWLQQMQDGTPDSKLTKKLATQIASGKTNADDLLLHVHADIDNEADTLWEATLDDKIPTAETYPAFDLSFIKREQEEQIKWDLSKIQRAIENGLKYFEDEAGSVVALVGQMLQGPAASAVSARTGGLSSSLLKSSTPGAQLFHYVIGESEGLGWEMEVIGFVENEETCAVEVSIFDHKNESNDIPLTIIYDGAVQKTQSTNEYGVTIFEKIARDNLATLSIGRPAIT